MGKVNKRNVRTKAKMKLAKAASATRVAGEKMKAATAPADERSSLVLHKTITPKKSRTKRDKLKQRHKNLVNKFALMKKKIKEEAARKRREKTAVVGDMRPLRDALPSLDELLKMTNDRKDLRTGVKEYDEGLEKLSARKKMKVKRNIFISKVNAYQALLNDPDFKKNPRDVIAFHIKHKYGLLED